MTIEETTGEDRIGDTAKVPAEGDQPLLEDEEALETEASTIAYNGAENTDGESVEKSNGEDEQNQKTFPQKLMELLSDEANEAIVSWLPHGNAFHIHKKSRFADEVLPKYFKATKFTSFTRKLNRWGFHRVPRGHESGSYYHPCFRRDEPAKCLQMASNASAKYNGSMPSESQSQILPAIPGMMGGHGMPGIPGIPGMFPSMSMIPGMMSPQQQMMWQQQQMYMMQMQMQMQMYQQSQMQTQQAGLSLPVTTAEQASAVNPSTSLGNTATGENILPQSDVVESDPPSSDTPIKSEMV